MRRILVLAYYFPPMGLSGVQRISKFVKYLPEFGWAPHVITAAPGGYFAFDQGLRDELDKSDIRITTTATTDPTRAVSGVVAPPSEFKRRVFSWVSSFLFVPDNKVGWVPHARRAALSACQQSPFDAILATAPPYSAVKLGRDVSHATNTPLVCDFRDDWIGNPRHVYPTPLHRRLHRDLEERVIKQSAAVVTINSYIAASLASRHPDRSDDIHVLSHGFDPADFDALLKSETPAPAADDDGPLRFVYAGTFYDAQQPDTFLRALERLRAGQPSLGANISVRLVGTFQKRVSELVQALGLNDQVEIVPYVEHAEVIRELNQADVLWMTVGRQPGGEQISTSKLYEYFGTRKPVLGLVPKGAARDAIKGYSAGFACDPDDVGACRAVMQDLVNRKRAGTLPVATRHEVAQYDRRRLTGRLAQLLETVAVSR